MPTLTSHSHIFKKKTPLPHQIASATLLFPPNNNSTSSTSQQQKRKLELARLAASKAATALPSAAETIVNAAANAAASGGAATAEEQKEALLESLGGPQGQGSAAAGKGSGAWKGKNVIIFLSDQESPLLHVPNPPEWERKNLPGATRLKQHGVEFKRAYTNACMCTAARATLFTGFLSTQTNARYVLEEPMPSALYPQVETPDDLPNLATAARAAGYEEGVVFKGKLHLTKPRNEDYSWSSADALKYGFSRWNYPDAGSNQSLSEAGGSPAFNDRRFMESVGPESEGKEGVFQFLRERGAAAARSPSSPINRKKPWFLVISLVNPHDVLFYPMQFAASGYEESMLVGDVQLPPTYAESLLTKPRAQREWAAFNVGARLLLLVVFHYYYFLLVVVAVVSFTITTSSTTANNNNNQKLRPQLPAWPQATCPRPTSTSTSTPTSSRRQTRTSTRRSTCSTSWGSPMTPSSSRPPTTARWRYLTTTRFRRCSTATRKASEW